MKDLRKYENLHVAFWLVKDACWCMLFRPLGMIMIVPTLFVALHITWITRHDRTDLFHNIAITLWICANATWMTGEFYANDNMRPVAMVFFILGLITVAIYYLFIARTLRDDNKGNKELISQ
ncbi:MAG: hypothetical protein JWO03_70 [Bacteroidetes bacterium]|nr:hypothetical protein [Bacteroidota bacterium]